MSEISTERIDVPGVGVVLATVRRIRGHQGNGVAREDVMAATRPGGAALTSEEFAVVKAFYRFDPDA